MDGFISEDDDEYKTISYLTKEITDLVGVDIARITGTDNKGLKVDVNATTDSMNRKIYAVQISNYESPILETNIKPGQVENNSTNNIEERKIVEGINQVEGQTSDSEEFQNDDEFLASLVSKYIVKDEYRKANEDDAKAFIVHSLLGELRQYNTTESFAKQNNFVSTWVENEYPFTKYYSEVLQDL